VDSAIAGRWGGLFEDRAYVVLYKAGSGFEAITLRDRRQSFCLFDRGGSRTARRKFTICSDHAFAFPDPGKILREFQKE
jgi:hypothetical protein